MQRIVTPMPSLHFGPSSTLQRDTCEELDALLARTLPGVRLESTVQAWAYLDRFEQGVRAYQELNERTPEDDRWLGVCYFKLFDDVNALEAFTSASQRGAIGARVNQAHALMYLDRREEATRILDQLNPEGLSRYDQVLFFRVRSLDEETSGNIRLALKHAEEAWRRVQGMPEFNVLAPSVLAQLGVLYARYGRAQRALWHLERGIQMTVGAEQLKVRLKRAIVLTTLGRSAEARSELNSMPLVQSAPALMAEKTLLLGDVAWVSGELENAISHYRDAIKLAVDAELAYEEYLCHLAVMTLTGFLGRRDEASRHRAEAKRRIGDKSDSLQFRFRELLLDYWCGDSPGQDVTAELTAISKELFEMGLLQEMGSVRVHIAAIELAGAPDQAATLLDELHILGVTLQNSSFLSREWVLLPELRRVASQSHPSLAGSPHAILELRTLGQERIILAGADVRLPLRRAVELLAYFLEHKAATFEQVRGDLFPEEKHRTAKSYFHQFRHQLKETVEGLEIEYDAESRMYRLKSEIDILWDVADLRAGRRSEAAGPFLPSCTSDWALTLDHALERYRAAH
jgi:tetratricopeptide (TPR) repeat protein